MGGGRGKEKCKFERKWKRKKKKDRRVGAAFQKMKRPEWKCGLNVNTFLAVEEKMPVFFRHAKLLHGPFLIVFIKRFRLPRMRGPQKWPVEIANPMPDFNGDWVIYTSRPPRTIDPKATRSACAILMQLRLFGSVIVGKTHQQRSRSKAHLRSCPKHSKCGQPT